MYGTFVADELTENVSSPYKVLKISQQIHSNIEGKLSKKQREFYLRQQVMKSSMLTFQ